MSYNLNSLIRIKDLKVLAQNIKAKLDNIGSSMEWPDSDDKYYVAKNGNWVEINPLLAFDMQTGEQPSDKYPMKWGQLGGSYGTDSTGSNSTTYYSWNDTYGGLGMFSYNGNTYLLRGYTSRGSTTTYYNYLHIIKPTGYEQKYITCPTNNQMFSGGAAVFYVNEGYLYIYYSNKIYTLNLSTNANKLVELDSGYRTTNVHSFCYSPTLGYTLLIFAGGEIQTMTGTPNVDMAYPARVSYETLSPISPMKNECVWSDELEVFCVAGSNGTAVSSDDLTWTIQKNVANLRRLSWLPEHHCFYAWKNNIPCKSPDGLVWAEMTSHVPSGLTSYPAGIIYIPEIGIFCLNPSYNSSYMLISNDMKTWARIEIDAGHGTYGMYWDSNNQRLLTTRKVVKNSTTYNYIYTLEF